MKFILCLVLACLVSHAATFNSDGSPSDVQAKINLASANDTIVIPSGSFTWATGVTVNKGVLITGNGAGRIVARSTSSVSVGTGTKNFTLITESVASIEALKSALVPGVTVRIEEVGNVANFMQGTVTSFGGSSLVIDSTSTGGSGTIDGWTVSTIPITTIIHSAGENTLFTYTESTVSSLRFQGIAFRYGTGTGYTINGVSVSGGRPIIISNCWIRLSTVATAFRTSSVHGLVYSSSFDSAVFDVSTRVAFQFKDASGADPLASETWTQASTLGTNDITGTSNFYVEDCDFHAMNVAFDADDYSRVVFRRCLFDNAAGATHGADTSFVGTRQWEIYENEFAFYDRGSATFNLQNWFLMRGGTGVIWGNIMPDINSTEWGSKPEVRGLVINLVRNSGSHPEWGKNPEPITGISAAGSTTITTGNPHGMGTLDYVRIVNSNSTPSVDGKHQVTVLTPTTYTIPVTVSVAGNTGVSNRVDWPAPRQVGMGRITGAGGTDTYTYEGDPAPIYQWDNTGGGDYASPSITNDSGFDPAENDEATDYISVGRDYLNLQMPGYVPYTYPHPLRNAQGSGNAIATSVVTVELTLP